MCQLESWLRVSRDNNRTKGEKTLLHCIEFFNDLKLSAFFFMALEPGLGLRDINLDAVRTLCG